jgi:hypothetical protein
MGDALPLSQRTHSWAFSCFVVTSTAVDRFGSFMSRSCNVEMRVSTLAIKLSPKVYSTFSFLSERLLLQWVAL